MEAAASAASWYYTTYCTDTVLCTALCDAHMYCLCHSLPDARLALMRLKGFSRGSSMGLQYKDSVAVQR